MIVLEEEKESIKKFIIDSTETFKIQNGKFTSIGLYCCPWAGWLSINFNTEKSLAETGFNCPDFDVVEFNLLELIELQNEYESNNPEYMLEGKIIAHDYDLGDEFLNGLFFKFLTSIILNIQKEYKEEILLQILDSKCRATF